jgi:hypothetical protein
MNKNKIRIEEKNRLQVVLAEYTALRCEIIDKFRLQLQIYSIYASALLIFYGLMFSYEFYDIIIAIPFFSLVLFYRILWEQKVIRTLGEYIVDEIEKKKIPMLIGKINKNNKKGQESKYTDLWMGWEHFWIYKRKKRPRYYTHSLFVLFPIFSVIPSILYNIFNICTSSVGIQLTANFPLLSHGVLLVINIIIYFYMIYRIIYM